MTIETGWGRQLRRLTVRLSPGLTRSFGPTFQAGVAVQSWPVSSKYPHMGMVVLSGMVAVDGRATRLYVAVPAEAGAAGATTAARASRAGPRPANPGPG